MRCMKMGFEQGPLAFNGVGVNGPATPARAWFEIWHRISCAAHMIFEAGCILMCAHEIGIGGVLISCNATVLRGMFVANPEQRFSTTISNRFKMH